MATENSFPPDNNAASAAFHHWLNCFYRPTPYTQGRSEWSKALDERLGEREIGRGERGEGREGERKRGEEEEREPECFGPTWQRLVPNRNQHLGSVTRPINMADSGSTQMLKQTLSIHWQGSYLFHFDFVLMDYYFCLKLFLHIW